MVERTEIDSSTARKEAATKIITSRNEELIRIFGTATHAGSEPTRWKPYHVVENFRSAQSLESLFAAALQEKDKPDLDSETHRMLSDLQEDDLPAMQVAIKLIFPDFNNLYVVNPSLAFEKMEEAHVFTERDFALVAAVIDAAIVKRKPEDPIVPKPIESDTPFAAHRKIFVDAVWGTGKSLPDTMYLLSLLAVEQLIENDAIHTIDGSLPRTLEEATAHSTTYDSEIVRSHIDSQYQHKFRSDITYVPQLASSIPYTPYFSDNQNYFIENILPRRNQPAIDLSSLVQDTREFSQKQHAKNAKAKS